MGLQRRHCEALRQPRTGSTGWQAGREPGGAGTGWVLQGPVLLLQLCWENKQHRQALPGQAAFTRRREQTNQPLRFPSLSWDGATIPRGSRWQLVGSLEPRRAPCRRWLRGYRWEDPGIAGSMPVHASQIPSFPNSTPHPPGWGVSLVAWVGRSPGEAPLQR